MTSTDTATGERADLLSALAKQRYFLRYTARDLTDEQAGQRTTASALCVGGAIKHVTQTERQWTQFIVDGPSAMAWDESNTGDYMDGFRMLEGETLAGLLADYDQVAQRTSDLIPLCHPLALSKVAVSIEIDDTAPGLAIRAEVKTTGPTGVELEALTAVSVAGLTLYDMLKAVDKTLAPEGVRLVKKTGGRSGDFDADAPA